ncbi:MAG: UDP-N-acetylglucosamine diphosphorylase/glucosamine-phosphate N-acetyltransferase [Thermoleophilia bacterium]|nr:UDP-N-acetylglucosamine diphosphorylase/glucosamine-phosphate N-acetyltransferase [Thermoleophilia bacterium]
MVTSRALAVVILAAGKGTRMKSDLPKVLHPVLGRSSLDWVIEAARPLEPAHVVVVVGHGGDQVASTLPSDVSVATQEQQLGTGDAVRAGLSALPADLGDVDVLVLNGDGAMFSTRTLRRVMAGHVEAGSLATVLSIDGDLSWPLGRVETLADGSVTAIIEAADATPGQLANPAMNAGIYAFDLATLHGALPRLSTDNAKGELYLTDIFGLVRDDAGRTLGVSGDDPGELLGINTRADLAEVEDVLRRRVLREHMLNGVTISMPDTVLIEPTVTVEPDAVILPQTILRGTTRIAAGAVVGPGSGLHDTVVEAGATVERSVAREARIGAGATVGPFAYLRPGADLRAESKAGAFVEIKNSVVGARSKVPHLSYVGDATIGEDSNIGAGNITANYRPELGRGKQRTTIGSNVRTGSDCVLVAPITIGDGAWTGAGSIVVQDVPAGALAIARARQTNIEGYADKVMDGAT